MIDSYDKLPLGRYLDLCAIDPALPDIDRQVAMVSVLSGIPEDDLLNMPVPDYSALAVKTAFLGEEPPEPKERIMREYRLGDLTLVPVTDVRRMTTAQFIDFQTYVREPDGHEADILTVFLVPKGKRYNDGYDVADVRAAILEHLSVTLAQDLRAFFFGRCRDYALAILTYSGWQTRRIRDRETRRIRDRETRKAMLERIAEARKAMLERIAEARTSLRAAGDGFATLTRYPRPADAAGMRSGIWP